MFCWWLDGFRSWCGCSKNRHCGLESGLGRESDKSNCCGKRCHFSRTTNQTNLWCNRALHSWHLCWHDVDRTEHGKQQTSFDARGPEEREKQGRFRTTWPWTAQAFRRVVGQLLWMCHVRTDTMFSTKELSRRLSAPTQEHMTRLKHLLRYLRGTRPGKRYKLGPHCVC